LKLEKTDKKRRKKLFEEGNILIVYLIRERIPARAYNKLKSKKYELFKIVKKISDIAYVVNLPSDMVISKIFNVINLYEYHPTE